jgi:hypothetical protein
MADASEDSKRLLVARIAKTIYDALKTKSDLRNLVQNIDEKDENGNQGLMMRIFRRAGIRENSRVLHS